MTLEEFLAAPLATVAQHAPRTVLWVVEGTRRSAALAGVEPLSEEYPVWSVGQLIECAGTIFEHGIEHIVTPLLTPSHFRESTPRYRERLFDWVRLFVANEQIRRQLDERGWRVRLYAPHIPELVDVGARLLTMSPPGATRTLWLVVVSEPDVLWQHTIEAIRNHDVHDRASLIRALYGEDIPPAQLLISFGKPVVSPDQLPPALLGKTDCYWTQRPGYRITRDELRAILHDRAFVRRTWVADKTGRAEESLKNRVAWERGGIIGLGMRLGPHWYPAPFAVPSESS